jgi:hypothetical protein
LLLINGSFYAIENNETSTKTITGELYCKRHYLLIYQESPDISERRCLYPCNSTIAVLADINTFSMA